MRISTMSPKNSAPFHMMAKPVSYRCNLKCDYCFYLEKETMMAPSPQTMPLMPNDVLKRYIKDYIESQPTAEIDFAWQGGEPTLAGLDFFKQVVRYQQQFANGKRISNSFQTNAIAINRQWAAFFAEHQFLLGVSVDGDATIHDKYRVSVNGKPTFDRVRQSIELLKEHQVAFNTLTVINDHNWHQGKAVYSALKELGSQYLQFIPIVEVSPCSQTRESGYAPQDNPQLAPFSVPAEGYGTFMTEVFNEWVKHDIGNVYVRLFDSLLATWMGYPAAVCVQSKNCGQAIVVEANGDLYSCDHYVYPENKLGNLMQTNIAKLALSKTQRQFGQMKSSRLSAKCQSCDVLGLCYGGCPKHRITSLPGERQKQNYLCASYQRIFHHTATAMHAMSTAIKRGGTAADVMPYMAQYY